MLGCRWRGGVPIALVLAAIAGIVVYATRIALLVLAKLEASGAALEVSAITAAAHEAMRDGGTGVMQALLAGIVACWLFAMVDAFRIGRRMDRARQVAEDAA